MRKNENYETKTFAAHSGNEAINWDIQNKAMNPKIVQAIERLIQVVGFQNRFRFNRGDAGWEMSLPVTGNLGR